MNKIILVIVTILIVLTAVFLWQYKENLGPINILYNNTTSNNTNGNIVSQDKVLNLNNQGLTKIPEYVFNKANLEELNVSHNSLTGAIQSQIGQLKKLKVLNASYNQMTGVPAEVGQLQNLQVLDLSYNQLTGLPNELGNLKNLKTLNLTGNSYSQQDLDYIRGKLPPTVNIIVSQTQPENLSASVSIKNFAFNPTPLTIKVGTTVTWTNNDSAPHQIKSDTFNSAMLSNGGNFQFTFSAVGQYSYLCSVHPSMQGQIIVTQ